MAGREKILSRWREDNILAGRTDYTLKAQPLLGSPKHRTPRFDRGVLADWFLSPVKNIPVISFSTQMVTLVSSVSVGTLCFTSKKGRTDFLAIFGYLFERNT